MNGIRLFFLALFLVGCLGICLIVYTKVSTIIELFEIKQSLQKNPDKTVGVSDEIVAVPDGIIEPDKVQKKSEEKQEKRQREVCFTEILEEKIPRTLSRSISLDYYKIEKEIYGAAALGIGIGMGMAFQEKDDKEEFLKIVPKDKVVNYTVTVNEGRGKCQFHFNCYYAESGLLTLYKETHEIENCISLIPDKEDTGKIIIVYEERISDE